MSLEQGGIVSKKTLVLLGNFPQEGMIEKIIPLNSSININYYPDLFQNYLDKFYRSRC